MAKLTFLGAAGTVTGSKYLVEAEGKRLLVDCGLFQGLKELRLRNWISLPEMPSSFDWCVLTHAHLDHTGYLPRLFHDGYTGPVFADACHDRSCAISFFPIPHIFRKMQRGGRKQGPSRKYSKHQPPLPLYTQADVEP